MIFNISDTKLSIHNYGSLSTLAAPKETEKSLYNTSENTIIIEFNFHVNTFNSFNLEKTSEFRSF